MTSPSTAVPARCEVAAFLVDSPDIVGAPSDEVLRMLRARWPSLGDEEIEGAEDIALFLNDARRAERQTDAEYLIEKTRLLFGAFEAAKLAYKFGLTATHR